MAIPASPSNLILQTANVTNLITWSASAGALSYDVQRSLDGVNFTSLTTVVIPKYLDTDVVSGTQYWYQVASVNLSGASTYADPGPNSVTSLVPAPTAEMSLLSLRTASKQKADRIDSEFVTDSEWNTFIGLAMYELYDLLIGCDVDLFMAPRVKFNVTNNQFIYPLPDGLITFTSTANTPFIAAPFYKLLGVDLALNTSNNAFVTVSKYNLIDRNNYVYPNSNSTVYGVFNLQYRLMSNNIEFIPTPTAGQTIQLLYIPRLPEMIQDTDISTIGFSGWLQYAIVRAAKYALDKEESDTSKLDAELLYLKGRIEETAVNRDEGRPDTISDVRRGSWGGNGPFNSFQGGW